MQNLNLIFGNNLWLSKPLCECYLNWSELSLLIIYDVGDVYLTIFQVCLLMVINADCRKLTLSASF